MRREFSLLCTTMFVFLTNSKIGMKQFSNFALVGFCSLSCQNFFTFRVQVVFFLMCRSRCYTNFVICWRLSFASGSPTSRFCTHQDSIYFCVIFNFVSIFSQRLKRKKKDYLIWQFQWKCILIAHKRVCFE